MSKIALEDVLHLLTEYNHWWQSGNVVADKVPCVKRIAFYNAMRLMQKNQVVLLHGGRQVGKSTILFQLIQELINQGVSPNRIVYIPLNHPIFKFFSPAKSCACIMTTSMHQMILSISSTRYNALRTGQIG